MSYGELGYQYMQDRIEELEEENKRLRDYKIFHDRVFEKSVVIPTEEYSNMITRIKNLEEAIK